MKQLAKGFVLSAAVVCLVFQSGCAVLEGLTKTSTTDGDFKHDLGEYHGLKHAVGCIDFKNEAGWQGRWKIGNNLSVLLESALFDTGRFVIVEREKLGAIMKEQDLVTSGRSVKTKRIARTGLIRPARYIATGAVTEVSEGVSGGGGGVSFAGIRLGGSSSKAQVTIIVKLIDSTTSEMKFKKTIKGRAGRVGVKVGMHRKGVGANMGGFAKTSLGEAAQDCINQAAVFLAKQCEKALPFDGSVVQVKKGRVMINRGSDHGLTVGKVLVLRDASGEPVTDPETGGIIDDPMLHEEIGKVKVTIVRPRISFCSVTEGGAKPARGTTVTEN